MNTNDMTIDINTLPEVLVNFFQSNEVRLQERDGGIFLSNATEIGAPESVTVRSVEELNSKLREAEQRAKDPNTVWMSSDDFFDRARANL